MDVIEFIEEIYGIELLRCQKELLRRYADLPEGSKIDMGRDGPILLDKDGKRIMRKKSIVIPVIKKERRMI